MLQREGIPIDIGDAAAPSGRLCQIVGRPDEIIAVLEHLQVAADARVIVLAYRQRGLFRCEVEPRHFWLEDQIIKVEDGRLPFRRDFVEEVGDQVTVGRTVQDNNVRWFNQFLRRSAIETGSRAANSR